jgi:hypothetical protein
LNAGEVCYEFGEHEDGLAEVEEWWITLEGILLRIAEN